MSYIKGYILQRKYIFLFLSVLILFGIIIGLILGITNIELLKTNVIQYVNNITLVSYNYILFHFFILVISLIASFFAIGIPLLCAMIFYEGLTCGFLIGIFTFTYGLGGLIFSILFYIFTKLVFLILLIFFFLKCLSIARKMIGKFIYKTDPSIMLVRLLKGCFAIIFLVLICDTAVLLIGNKIIPLFQFLVS